MSYGAIKQSLKLWLRGQMIDYSIQFYAEFRTVFLFSVCILDEASFRFEVRVAKMPTFQNTKF